MFRNLYSYAKNDLEYIVYTTTTTSAEIVDLRPYSRKQSVSLITGKNVLYLIMFNRTDITVFILDCETRKSMPSIYGNKKSLNDEKNMTKTLD
jgi:hypothetical protein